MKKGATICLTVLMLALWAATPFFFREKQAAPQTREAVTLIVDVIPGADVGSGSRENWLRSRAEEFEKKNPNVYITVRALKTDQARTIYENEMQESVGNLVAYSTGGFPCRDLLLPLELPQCERIAQPLARSGGDCAAAYMYSGYVLLADRALSAHVGDQNADDAAALVRAVPAQEDGEAAFAACADETDNGAVAAALTLGAQGFGVQIVTRLQSNSLFSSQDCSVMTASHYTAYRFKRLAASGEGNEVVLAPMASGFTDQVHYLSIVDSSDAQNEAARAFVAFLLEDEAQKKTADVGMFPATDVDVSYEEGTILRSLFDCRSEQILCPDAFAWPAQRQMAQTLAAGALAGDETALRDLEKLLQCGVDRNLLMR